MDTRLLYKKEIEALDLVRSALQKNDYELFCKAKAALYDFFFENEYNMRLEFISLFPAVDVCWVRDTIEILQKASSDIGTTISSTDIVRGIKKVEAIANLGKIINTLEDALTNSPDEPPIL